MDKYILMKATAYGMNCREIIISLVRYFPKKKHNRSACGGQRRKQYLKEHRHIVCTAMLTESTLKGGANVS